MTGRLLVLFVIAGALLWARHALMVRSRRDAGRTGRGLPAVPSALRGGGAAWIVFTSPLCTSCVAARDLLSQHRPDDRVVIVDASRDPELAARWNIQRAPTVLHANAQGTVTARLVGPEAVRSAVAGDPL